MSFGDVITVLGVPPLVGIYCGSLMLLASVAAGGSLDIALRGAERAAAVVTAVLAPPALVVSIPVLGLSP